MYELPSWAQAVNRQRHYWVEKELHGDTLTEREVAARERCYSLWKAYQRWDCNENEDLFGLRLFFHAAMAQVNEGWRFLEDAEAFLKQYDLTGDI